jgi:pimeloyl-ACP methyl ester carboxylesterase
LFLRLRCVFIHAGMPHVRVGEVELYYELVDCTEPWHSGPPPIVLLHGLGTDRRIWLYQVPELCGRVPTILVDLRGHGRSSAPDGEWSVADMAHDVVRLLRHLGAERVHLLGLSMGGMVAQQFALDYPYATASLLLASTVSGIPADAQDAKKESLQFIANHSMAEVAQARITAAFSDAVDPVMRLHLIESVALNRKPAYEQAARAVFGFSITQRLDEISVPTLVVAGAAERTFPLAWVESLAQRIRGARLVTIPGAAHLCNMERPREFNRAVLEFLGV